jgi:hypothetical protein
MPSLANISWFLPVISLPSSFFLSQLVMVVAHHLKSFHNVYTGSVMLCKSLSMLQVLCEKYYGPLGRPGFSVPVFSDCSNLQSYWDGLSNWAYWSLYCYVCILLCVYLLWWLVGLWVIAVSAPYQSHNITCVKSISLRNTLITVYESWRNAPYHIYLGFPCKPLEWGFHTSTSGVCTRQDHQIPEDQLDRWQ